jgi:hypothetical protein
MIGALLAAWGGGIATFALVDPPTFEVTTAQGAGADAQLSEHNNNGTTSASGGDFNTRTSSNGDRNELVALRFDLSEHTLAGLADVTLNIVNFRANSARQVALYGVKQGSVGGSGIFTTENWDETFLATFGDMPGVTVTDGDFTTQNLNPEQVTFLGQITFANLEKGSIETFSDPALTAFIRAYTDSKLVTFLLAAAPGYTSTGQARFASKEAVALDGGEPTGAPGDFAPFLNFRQAGGANPPSVLITAPVNGADLDLGTPINIDVTTIHDRPIRQVEFYAGTEEPFTLLGEDISSPYAFVFTPEAAGTYTIRAVATDDQGLAGEHSVTIDIGVANPPTVTITSPAEGTEILKGSTTIIAATVLDDLSVTKTEFFAGTSEPLTLLGQDTTAPYTFEFTPATPGAYSLLVVGTDNLGLTNAALIAVTVVEPAANLRAVTTAFGLGADVQISEHNDNASGGGSDLNTRTSMNADRNEIAALRFDLSDYTLADLSEITLNIINFRNNSARQVALYGVRQGAKGGTEIFSTEDWEETGLAVFGDMPGLLITDGDFITQSIDEANVTALGQITFANLTKGTIETFGDPALTDFVQTYASSKVMTFLLAAAPGYTSTGQARFASKEALALEGDEPVNDPGKYAPFLSFKTGGVPELRITSINRSANELTLDWSGGAAPYTVQKKTSLASPTWVDSVTGVTDTSATIPIDGSAGFLRIQGQ